MASGKPSGNRSPVAKNLETKPIASRPATAAKRTPKPEPAASRVSAETKREPEPKAATGRVVTAAKRGAKPKPAVKRVVVVEKRESKAKPPAGRAAAGAKREAQPIGKRLCDHKLPTVCKALGVELKSHHDAMADARACAELALRFLERDTLPVS